MGSVLFLLCLTAYGVGLYFTLRRWHRREQARIRKRELKCVPESELRTDSATKVGGGK